MRTAQIKPCTERVHVDSARNQSFWLTLRAHALAANRSRASSKPDESATCVRIRQPRSELLT